MNHLGGGILRRVLLRGSIITWSSLEVLLEEASPAFVLGACSHGLSLMVTNLSEQTIGLPGPTMGRRSSAFRRPLCSVHWSHFIFCGTSSM